MDTPLESPQADRRRGDVGRLGVVYKADAADLGDLLEPVRDAGEAAQALAHRVAVDAHRERRRGNRHRVGGVVLAEDAELGDGEQRLAVVEDRLPGEGDLALGTGAVTEGDAAGAAAEVDPGEGRVVGVVDGDVVIALVGEDPQLGVEVGTQVGVAVEVVGRQVEEDRALGSEGDAVLELEARGLADHGRRGIDLSGQRRERRADVAGHGHRLPGGPVDVPKPLDHGRLAVGPGHGNEPVRDRPPGNLELPSHVDPPLQGGSDHRRPPRNPGTLDHSPHPVQERQAICIQKNFDADPPKPCNPIGMPRIDPLYGLTATTEQSRNRLPRPSQPHNQKRPPEKLRA